MIRGYPVDEMMGRLSFADAVYLLLMGELPTPAIGRMLNAILVSIARSRRHAAVDARRAERGDHRARRSRTASAAGILAFGPHHGGDIESCMRFLDRG